LAIGPERGWSTQERDFLRANGFSLCHMGQRVLRVETAVVAAVGAISPAYWAGKGWAGR
jgi:RsmE family RNA methyltransferase